MGRRDGWEAGGPEQSAPVDAQGRPGHGRPQRAFLCLGSNLGSSWGDARTTVLAAVEDLARSPGVTHVVSSRVYRTEPVGPVRQPDFANLVAEVETTLASGELLRRCQEVEDRFGRRRGQPLGPRTLDVDLLLLGDRIESTLALRLPHPRLHQRRFMLRPLADIAPETVHPELGRTVRELLAELDDTHRVVPWDGCEQAGRRGIAVDGAPS